MTIIILIALSLVMGFLGRYVAMEKNRSEAEGFWIGFLFSVLGVIIVALLPTKEKEKPIELTDERRKEMELKADALKEKDYPLGWIFLIVFLASLIVMLVTLN